MNPVDLLLRSPRPDHLQLPVLIGYGGWNIFDQEFANNATDEDTNDLQSDGEGSPDQSALFPRPPRQLHPASVRQTPPAPRPTPPQLNVAGHSTTGGLRLVNQTAPSPARGGRPRERCYPCRHRHLNCDLKDRTAAAISAGQNLTTNPICCSNCERKAESQAGFQVGFCMADDDASREAGYQGYIDGWHVKYGRK